MISHCADLEATQPLLEKQAEFEFKGSAHFQPKTQSWLTNFKPMAENYLTGRLHHTRSVTLLLCRALFPFVALITIFVSLTQIVHLRGCHNCFNNLDQKACSSEEWASGQWVQRTDPRPTSYDSLPDLLHWAGFPGDNCAANDRLGLHLVLPHPGEPNATRWNKIPNFSWADRMKLSNYKWQSGCKSDGKPEQQMTPERLLTKLIYDGAWMLIGDSVTNQWMTSLSCYLAPYVISVPDWTKLNYTKLDPYDPYPPPTTEEFDEHLFLNPDSKFVQSLKLPKNFNISSSPVVTTLRSDLLLSSQDFVDALQNDSIVTESDGDRFLGNLDMNARPLKWDDKIYEIPITNYFNRFIDPKMSYSKLVASTGPHWTTYTFDGLTLEQIAHVYRVAMAHWSKLAVKALNSQDGQGKQIILKSTNPGHADCHTRNAEATPWEDIRLEEQNHEKFHWTIMFTFNAVGKMILESFKHPRLRYLGLERPGALRPNAHPLKDCLHIGVGSGVIEGWTEFLYRDQVF